MNIYVFSLRFLSRCTLFDQRTLVGEVVRRPTRIFVGRPSGYSTNEKSAKYNVGRPSGYSTNKKSLKIALVVQVVIQPTNHLLTSNFTPINQNRCSATFIDS